MLEVRYAKEKDFDWLSENDNHVNKQWVERCISHEEYIIALENQAQRGFLRFSFFWGDIPYMDLIRINKDYRRKGIGTAMFNFWEQEMRKRSNAKVLMTSSVIDETEPQTWHKRNGFKECGQLTFGQHEPTPEIFFIKEA